MAQRTEKEETEFKVVPETTITLCVKCRVASNSAANNLCQTCFAAATTVVTATSPKNSLIGEKSFRSGSPERLSTGKSLNLPEPSGDLRKEVETAAPVKKQVNRCSCCRRKVGLTGFRCRCGELFCGDHRYSDRHDCSYDYKAAGREAIAKENPVVKAAKIVKI